MMPLIRTALIFAALIFFGAQFIASNGLDWAMSAASPKAPAAKPAARSYDQHGSELRVASSGGGHFIVNMTVNNTRIPFLVDTGASGIALTRAAAAAAGIRPAPSEFTSATYTANGRVLNAPVRLREMRLGSFAAYDVEAHVNGGDLHISLLGMSFLRLMQSYEVVGDELRLRW